jgi:peptide/nickel transport system permease protein
VLGVPLGLAAAARGGWLDEAIMRGQRPGLCLSRPGHRGPDHRRYSGRRRSTRSLPSASSTSRSSPGSRAARRCRSGRSTMSGRRGWPGKDAARISVEHILPNIAPADRPGLDPVLAGHPGRGRAGLHGAGRAAAAAQLGPDAGRRADPGDALAPQLAVLPGLAITLTVLGLNLLGDGLRDRLDPRRAPP